MLDINYFQVLCFLWAGIGLLSRLAMVIMGEKWSEWELKSAYKSEKPKWIYGVGLLGYGLVIFTWYKFFTTNIKLSWIITLLVTLTVIKISAILFNYKVFRGFVKETLNNRKKIFRLNFVVVIFSIILILMGIYLY